MQASDTFLFKRNIFIIVGTLIVLSLLNVIYLGTFTKSDFLIFSLFGYGKGPFSLRAFLTILIINGLPLYLMGEFMAKNDFKKFNELQKRNLVFIVFYTVIQAIITIFIGRVFSTGSGVYTYMVEIAPYLKEIKEISSLNFMELSPIIVFLDGLILRVMELMVLQIIFLFIYMQLKNNKKAFLVCMVLHLFNVSKYFPIGISSIQRLLLLDDNFIFAVFKAIFVLGITYSLVWLFLCTKGSIACRLEIDFDELHEF